jgi:hypothetical protein
MNAAPAQFFDPISGQVSTDQNNQNNQNNQTPQESAATPREEPSLQISSNDRPADNPSEPAQTSPSTVSPVSFTQTTQSQATPTATPPAQSPTQSTPQPSLRVQQPSPLAEQSSPLPSSPPQSQSQTLNQSIPDNVNPPLQPRVDQSGQVDSASNFEPANNQPGESSPGQTAQSDQEAAQASAAGQVPDQQGWWQTPLNPQPEYLLLEWEADSRVSVRRTKQYYSSLAVIVLLVCLILFFAGQTLLIFVVLAFLFITYVLNSARAERVIHQLTTYGIRYRGERLFYWDQLGRFWTRLNQGRIEIHVEAPTFLGNELILLPSSDQELNAARQQIEQWQAEDSSFSQVNPEDVPKVASHQDIIDVLSLYLLFEEPIPSQLDRWVLWLQEKFPLD